MVFDEVRYFISGGDALPDKIATTFELIYRRKICIGYGLTECSPLVAAHFEDLLLPTTCVGKPVTHLDIALRTDTGDCAGAGQTGTLWIKGHNVMNGYYNAPQATAAIIQDGWLNSGDLAYVDDEGRLYIVGREKDLIVHKGIKVYPQEVENIIMNHTAVMRVAVIGIPVNGGDEIPVAYVQVKDVSEGIAQEIALLCNQHLAPYKVPRRFICSKDDLPLTATGKVDKKQLRTKKIDFHS